MTWQEQVAVASSEAEVILLAKDFLARLDPFEISMLPPQCLPRKLIVADDVSSYAFDLVDYETSVPEPTARVIQKMAAFFTRASVRLSELAARANDDADAEQKSA